MNFGWNLLKFSADKPILREKVEKSDDLRLNV